MTTLPPESNGDQPVNPTPPVPPAQPDSTAAPTAHTYGEPVQPAAPQTPPAPPAYEQPGQPAPQAPPAQPTYQQPAAGGYQQAPPPPGGYQQPAMGHQQPASDPVGNIQLNYWLSVFFTWIPALIFWLIEKDKGDQRAAQIHAANLNFSILRTAVALITWIPYIGWIVGVLGGIVLFVFHIIAATKAADAYRNGANKTDPFIFNIPLVK